MSIDIDAFLRNVNKIIKDPSNPQLYNAVAVFLYKLDDFNNAKKYIERAYMLDGEDDNILYNYAMILYKSLNFRRAIDAIAEYNIKKREYTELLKILSDCYYNISQYDKATAINKRLLELKGGEDV